MTNGREPEREFIPLEIAIVTVSDTRNPDNDVSGDTAARLLEQAGHRVSGRVMAPDDARAIQDMMGQVLGRTSSDALIITGGTGITPRDVTPEAVAPFVTKYIPGFGELFRWLSFADIGTATIQSRAEAMLCGPTLVFLLPGSPSAVRLAMEKILIPQFDNRTRPCNFVELLPRIREGR